MPTKVSLAKQRAKEQQEARIKNRLEGLAKKRKTESESPRKRKTRKSLNSESPVVQKSFENQGKTSAGKRTRSLIQDAIIAAKKKNKTYVASDSNRRTSAEQQAIAKARSLNRGRGNGVSSMKMNAYDSSSPASSPSERHSKSEQSNSYVDSFSKNFRNSPEEVSEVFPSPSESLCSEVSSTYKATPPGEYISKKNKSNYVTTTYPNSNASTRTVSKDSEEHRYKDSKWLSTAAMWKKLRFVLIVILTSLMLFLIGLFLADIFLGQHKNLSSIGEPKLLELPASADFHKVSDVLANEHLEDIDSESREYLRNVFDSLPKWQQDQFFAKSVHDLSLAVYRMEQTNLWLKYGVTFIGICTVTGWFLGPLLL